MYRTWAASAEDGESLARSLEAHLNEFAGEIISVAYAVERLHYVLAVYREIEVEDAARAQAALAEAEQIIDQVQM